MAPCPHPGSAAAFKNSKFKDLYSGKRGLGVKLSELQGFQNFISFMANFHNFWEACC